MKVLLILVDGMRPDAMKNIPEAKELMELSAYTPEGRTVFPSVTLPCHMSLFHSVDPMRHGTTTNMYAPQVRPVEGLCEVLRRQGKTSAFFYDWEELRDLTRPGSLSRSYFVSGQNTDYDAADEELTDEAIKQLQKGDIDFVFLYLGVADETGHKYGWMSEEYIKAVENSWRRIKKATKALAEDYTVIVTADHGGHDRFHGSESYEDMTIPLIIKGENFPKNSKLADANIIDIAPTITKLLGADASDQWEGKALF